MMTGKDPKDMTASELLRKAGNGYEGASGTVMTNLIDLMGLSRKIRHSECCYDLADKIDAELAQARKEAVKESKKPMWWFRFAISQGEDWPAPQDGETFRHYLDRCFIPRPAPDALGADGLPIKVGETVWGILRGSKGIVNFLNDDSTAYVEWDDGRWFPSIDCCNLTHTPPDTQERIDDDATILPRVYYVRHIGCDVNLKDDSEVYEATVRDLLRRQRELDKRKGAE